MKKTTNHKTSTSSFTVDENKGLEEQISQRAHENWQQRGGEPGGELADWLQAEREIHERQQKQPQKKTSSASGSKRS